jgi:starch phosphorylase
MLTRMTQPLQAGAADLARAADALASRVPAPLAPVARLAFNYRWSWMPGGRELFRDLEPHRWELCGENPVRLLQEASPAALVRAAADRTIVARAESLWRALCDDLARPTAPGPVSPERPVVFLCAEFAIHRSLPIYAGGLGVLAGDLAKEASDRALPFVGVGLLYRQGSFRQRLDPSGYQHEYWTRTDPERLPAALVTGADGLPLRIRVPLDDHDAVAQIWRVDVGRVPLFLLDAEHPENRRVERWTTARLYDGDRETRLAQYTLLGVGGIRALRALGIDPGVLHMNEGHAALAPLELAREETERGASFADAFASARRRTVFTTHTPVAAGNDEFDAGLVMATLGGFAHEAGLSRSELLGLGRRLPTDEGEPFGVTPLGLRASRFANGVSSRHGRVARAMWHSLWPDRRVEDVPIAHVTNGVHAPSWMAPAMQQLLARWLGADWHERAADPRTWDAVEKIPDEELWATRCALRSDLIEFARDRSVADRLARGGPSREYAQAAERSFDADVLTVGFARRIATYKRLHLLVRDPPRALRLLAGPRPMQVLLAGKAHPRDEEAKRLVQSLFPMTAATDVARRVAYLEDYDLGLAATLVAGCDVWVNLPRPPLEASGTSGMKAVLNGGLHLSVLDGWWEEAYDGHNGWGIGGEPSGDWEQQDARDAAELYHLLETEVVPTFYARDESGLPRAWIARIRASLRSLGPRVVASRMLEGYVASAYRGG